MLGGPFLGYACPLAERIKRISYTPHSCHSRIARLMEFPVTAFSSKKNVVQIPGRMVVRRIAELTPKVVPGSQHYLTRSVSNLSSPPSPPGEA